MVFKIGGGERSRRAQEFITLLPKIRRFGSAQRPDFLYPEGVEPMLFPSAQKKPLRFSGMVFKIGGGQRNRTDDFPDWSRDAL